jgi:hypothetical protein
MELRAKPLRAESKPIANCGIRISDLGNSKGVRAKGKSKKAIADFEFRIVVRIRLSAPRSMLRAISR